MVTINRGPSAVESSEESLSQRFFNHIRGGVNMNLCESSAMYLSLFPRDLMTRSISAHNENF